MVKRIGLAWLFVVVAVPSVVGQTLVGERLRITDLPSKSGETNCAWVDASGNFKTGACGAGDITGVSFTLPGLFSAVSACTSGDCAFTFSYATQTNWATLAANGSGVVSFQALGKSHLPSALAYEDEANTYTGKQTVTLTTSPQLQVGYDAGTNYMTVGVSSAGAVTFDTNGSSNSFTFSDPSTFSSTFTANGTTSLNGTSIGIGNATSDTVTFTARLAGHLHWASDATYDIGATTTTYRPRDLFLSRNATIGGTLGVTGNTTLTGDLAVNGGDITTASAQLNITPGGSADLLLNPGGDVVFNPTGNDLTPQYTYDLNIGSVIKKYLTLHAAELWVDTLVANHKLATIGGYIITAPTTKLTCASQPCADETLSAAATTIYVEHNQIAVNDTILLQDSGQIEFMLVTAGPSGAGPYSYTVTRNLDGTGANIWRAGAAVVNTGDTGDGFLEQFSVRGVKAQEADCGDGTSCTSRYGPTMVGQVRTARGSGANFSAWAEHWAIGNLNSLYGYGASDVYGVALGPYVADKPWVSADSTNGFRINRGTGGTVLGQWDTSGNISIGQPVSGATTENILLDSTSLKFRNGTTTYGELSADTWTLGEYASGKPNVQITPTSVKLRNYTTDIITLNGTTGTITGAIVQTATGCGTAATACVEMESNELRWYSATGPTLAGTISGDGIVLPVSNIAGGEAFRSYRFAGGAAPTGGFANITSASYTTGITYGFMGITNSVLPAGSTGENSMIIQSSGDTNQSSWISIVGGRDTGFTGAMTFTSRLFNFQRNDAAESVLYVDASSNRRVGVNTSSPAVPLDIDTQSNSAGVRIRGSAETTEIADLYHDATGFVVNLTPGSGSKFIDLRPESTSYGIVLRETDGTGTTTYANWTVVDDTVDYLNFRVNGTTSSTAGLFVDDDDQVGIGTSTPSVPLDVVGAANFLSGGATNEVKIGRNANEYLSIIVNDGGTIIESVQDEDSPGYGYIAYRVDDDGTTDARHMFQKKSGGDANIVAAGMEITNWIGVPGASYRTVCTSATSSGADSYLYYGPSSSTCDTSSIRYKTNVKPALFDFGRVLDLKPVTFEDKYTPGERFGLIAEEVEALGLTPLVAYNDAGTVEAVHYDKIALYLIPVLREQQARIAALEARLAALEAR